MITRAVLESLAPKIMERLSALAELPPSGTVAGQAVASMIYEELGLGVRGPINDIDVFVNLGLPRSLRGKPPLPAHHTYDHSRTRLQKTSASGMQLYSDCDTYEHVKFIALRSSVKIASTYNVGLLNYTLVSDFLAPPHPTIHRVSTSQTIVDGFDLNAVAVGINIASKQLVCSDKFVEFCNTRQLEVQTCNTPVHTLIRLAKKWWGQELLGASCDYEQQRGMLETAILCQKERLNSKLPHHMVINEFGRRYKDKAQPYAAFLPDLVLTHVYERHVDDSVIEQALQGQEPPADAYTYHMYGFDRLAPTPLSVYLGSKMHVLCDTVFSHAFVARFPDLYALLTSQQPQHDQAKSLVLSILEHAAPSSSEQLQAIETYLFQDRPAPTRTPPCPSTDGLDPETEVFLFNTIRQALGEPSIVYEMEGFHPNDSAEFFYQQHSARSPQSVNAVVSTWNNLSWADRHLVTHFHMRADQFMRWTNDPVKTFDELVRDCPSEVLHTLVRDASLDPLFGAPHGATQQFFATLAHLAATNNEMSMERMMNALEMGQHQDVIVEAFPSSSVSLDHMARDQRIIPSRTLLHLLKDAPRPIKINCWEHLQRATCVQGTDDHLHSLQSTALLLGLPLSQTPPALSAIKAALSVLRDYNHPTSGLKRDPNSVDVQNLFNNLVPWLDQLSDSEVFDPLNGLFRHLLAVGPQSHSYLQARAQICAEPQLTDALATATTLLERHINYPPFVMNTDPLVVPSSQQCIEWINYAWPEEVNAFLQKLSLSSHLRDVSSAPSLRRLKM